MRFDFVILDPPSLAKREAERSRAIQAYRKLASGGIQRLKRGGILVARPVRRTSLPKSSLLRCARRRKNHLRKFH